MAEEVKSYSQMRNEFLEKYQKIIVPKVKRYEAERKTRRLLAVFCFVVSIIIAGIIIYSAYKMQVKEDWDDVLQIAISITGLGYFGCYRIKKDFENRIKEKIMPTVCQCFNNLSWNIGDYSGRVHNLVGGPVYGMEGGKYFVSAGLFKDYSREKYDDVFVGTHKGVKFDIIESEFIKGSGKNKEYLFSGVIVKLDMNKNFNGHTLIKPDSMFHSSPKEGLRHTVLEDTVFESKFDVYTDDEVEARYLITTAFMERLNNMKTAFRATGISCAFYNQNLIIGLSTSQDLFSICSLFKPIDDASQYFQMYEEIVSIIKLIDYFKLDQKIGL